jgi:hypothetical protein
MLLRKDLRNSKAKDVSLKVLRLAKRCPDVQAAYRATKSPYPVQQIYPNAADDMQEGLIGLVLSGMASSYKYLQHYEFVLLC